MIPAGATTLLVTRPQPQADQWVAWLRAAGVTAQALPLISTAPPARPELVQAVWRSLPTIRLVMFVSPAAVQHFFDLRPMDAPWPEGTLAAAPGPGTAAVLNRLGLDAGLCADQILSPPADAEQFDSEHLWPVLAPLAWHDAQVVIASGGQGEQAQGRQWLSEQLRQRGATVHTTVCYQRGPAPWGQAEQALAEQALLHPQEHLWLLSASEAVQHLVQHHLPNLTGAPTHAVLAAQRALCTHPRVAASAQAAGMHTVWMCQPDPEAVSAFLKGPDLIGAADTMPSS